MRILPEGKIKLNRYTSTGRSVYICRAVAKWTGRPYRLVGIKVSKSTRRLRNRGIGGHVDKEWNRKVGLCVQPE